MKFLHVMIRVADIEKSLKFYTELLDLNLTHKMRLSDCTLYFLSDEDGQTQIELTHNDESPQEGYELGKGFGHFAFETSSMEDFSKKLAEFGGTYHRDPFKLQGHDLKIAFIRDPDGYEIEIIEG